MKHITVFKVAQHLNLYELLVFSSQNISRKISSSSLHSACNGLDKNEKFV